MYADQHYASVRDALEFDESDLTSPVRSIDFELLWVWANGKARGHGFRPETAEDIASVLSFRMLSNQASIIGKPWRQAITYLVSAFRNGCYDALRTRRSRSREVPLDMAHDPSRGYDGGILSVELHVAAEQIIDRCDPTGSMRKAVTDLSEGRTIEESAEELGVTTPALKSRLYRMQKNARAIGRNEGVNFRDHA